MPARNGAGSIEQAIESLLAQTEPGFVLLISDNCSTDETGDICRKLAAADPRVRYVRQTTNLGPAGNFNYLLQKADSPFFMWAAHDDVWAPDFLAETLSLLADSSDAIAAMTAVRFIGGGSSNTVYLPTGLSDADPVVRARSVNDGGWYAVYGLLRRDGLPAGIKFEDVSGPDMAFVFGLALYGRILTSGRALSTRRVEGYKEILGPDGRLVWQKALGPVGHLYSRTPNAMCGFMLRYTWGAPFSLAKKAMISGHIAHVWWWRTLRNEALHDSRIRIDAARKNRRYLLAILLTLRHAILRPGRALSEAKMRLGGFGKRR
jgi:glycosyltransferase involved in cell wall biosynthesis